VTEVGLLDLYIIYFSRKPEIIE